LATKRKTVRRTRQAEPADTRALHAALDALPVGFALFDADGKLSAWNARLAGLKLFPKRLLKKGTALGAFRAYDKALSPRVARPRDVELRKGVVLRATSSRVPPGNLLVAYEDVSSQKSAEAARDQARADADAALERQTATAEILKVISESPTDVQPVFQAIVENAARLMAPCNCGINMLEGDAIYFRAAAGATTTPEQLERMRALFPIPFDPNQNVVSRVIAEGRVIHVDPTARDAPPQAKAVSAAIGAQSMTQVPLMKAGKGIGVITVRSEDPAFRLSERQLALIRTFADQAVIAIENVRLFNETQEALERQTATAEILKVIASSPTDVQPVFDAIVKSALTLCNGMYANAFRYDGESLHFMANDTATEGLASHGPDSKEVRLKVLEAMKSKYPMRPDPSQISGRVILGNSIARAEDLSHDPDYDPRFLVSGGPRRMLGVPMQRDGAPTGVIVIAWGEPGPILQHHEDLLCTFADQAVIAVENVRLFNETKEALERQTATAEILRVISESPTDTQPVFNAIVQSGLKLFPGSLVSVAIRYGDAINAAAVAAPDPARVEAWRRTIARTPLARTHMHGAALLDRRIVDIPDVADAPAEFVAGSQNFLTSGNRAITIMPMMRGDMAIGLLSVVRLVAGPLSDRQRGLLRTFADQAVIAIENVRLFNETKEALERQTATAEILKVISESPTNVQPVFDAIVESCTRLLACNHATLRLVKGDRAEFAASNSAIGGKTVVQSPMSIHDDAWPTSQALARRAVVQIPDTSAEDVSAEMKQRGEQRGFRALMVAPLLRDNDVIGMINVHRGKPGRFTDKEVALLETFASQAVIAIENVRLFNETKEALERQTATAEILKVISESPTDTQPVFDAIAESARKLFGDAEVGMTLVRGDAIELVAAAGMSEERLGALRASFPRPLDLVSTVNTTVVDGQLIHYPDILAEDAPAYTRATMKSAGMRAMLGVPLLREGRSIGGVFLSRATPGAYTEHQIALLKTFADQAVIAIENVRLFNETNEALERQTATAEILRVISRSPTDEQPVFEAIVRSARRLCAATYSVVFLADGGQLTLAAVEGVEEAGVAALRAAYPRPIGRDTTSGRSIVDRRVVHLEDSWLDPDYKHPLRDAIALRSILTVPMFREGTPIGAVSVWRGEAKPFSEKQIALLQTFADQAVIAIENVRLFKELEQRTEALTRSVGQLTALGEVSQTISSTLDVEKVLPTIVSRAVQLTGLDGGAIYEYDELQQVFTMRAGENVRQEILELDRNEPIRIGEGAVGRAAATRKPVQVPDIAASAAGRQTRGRDVLLQIGARALLAVPLLREGHILGALAVIRNTPGEFPPEVIALLETFATQSAIAIQNARLFREIEEKSRQLEEASQHKSQFLASMSHELRTPLNAILGFNEMILGDIYGEVSEDMRPPLAQMQSSGKHLLGLINNVLDLAKIEANKMELSLADYAVQDTLAMVRATLQALASEKGLEFVVSAPEDLPLVYGDGGRLSQCLINLAGNAIKFTKEGRVEIGVAQDGETLRFSVSDTGIGIPPDKIDTLFTEFKQTDAAIASEYGGTGLGLAITKKFIEMHGGRIWIESELGKGSTFLFEIPLRVQSGAAA
jgi:GAF domain-containing protein